jgi:hypothetical protein
MDTVLLQATLGRFDKILKHNGEEAAAMMLK